MRFRPDRMVVATERCTEYLALSTGCNARRAFLTALGVTARFTARPGCMARRALRGTSNREKKPMTTIQDSKRSWCEATPAHGCRARRTGSRATFATARRQMSARPEALQGHEDVSCAAALLGVCKCAPSMRCKRCLRRPLGLQGRSGVIGALLIVLVHPAFSVVVISLMNSASLSRLVSLSAYSPTWATYMKACWRMVSAVRR